LLFNVSENDFQSHAAKRLKNPPPPWGKKGRQRRSGGRANACDRVQVILPDEAAADDGRRRAGLKFVGRLVARFHLFDVIRVPRSGNESQRHIVAVHRANKKVPSLDESGHARRNRKRPNATKVRKIQFSTFARRRSVLSSAGRPANRLRPVKERRRSRNGHPKFWRDRAIVDFAYTGG